MTRTLKPDAIIQFRSWTFRPMWHWTIETVKKQPFADVSWQSYHRTVKSAEVLVLWFRASTCFRFWSKPYAKRCTNMSLLSSDKKFFSLLELIYRVLSISECFLEKHYLLSILMKNLHKALRNNYAILCVKKLNLYFVVDQVFSVSGYDLENGKMSCKQKYWI